MGEKQMIDGQRRLMEGFHAQATNLGVRVAHTAAGHRNEGYAMVGSVERPENVGKAG